MKLRGKKATEILGQTVLWVILIASLLIFSVPFFFMITNSFEEFSYVLPYPPKLFPTRLDFSAYRHILSMDIFPTALANSVINTVITVVISVFVSTLSAYGFALHPFSRARQAVCGLPVYADDAGFFEYHPPVSGA